VVMVVVVGGRVAIAESCVPDCEGMALGDKVEDPKECHNYYICLGNNLATDHSVPCDNGTYFSPSDSDCIDETVPCNSTCGGGSLGCKLQCDPDSTTEIEFISDLDCNKYYICFSGNLQGPFTCPAMHPHFDGAQCVDVETGCCKHPCEPYCEAKDTIIPDPVSCKNFYFCNDVGIPDDIFKFACGDDKNFDLHLGECSASAPCVTICDNTTSKTTIPGQTTIPGKTTVPGQTTVPVLTTLGPNDCVASLVCSEQGYFPVCTSCYQYYFACTTIGQSATQLKCPGSLVFDPVVHVCLLPENCGLAS